MVLEDILLFAQLKSRLGYLADRQRVIAQNVANADTPGYTPHDLKPFILPQPGHAALTLAAVTPTQTSAMHLPGLHTAAPSGSGKPVEGADTETTLNGNSVVLEDEMLKMSQARMDYDAIVGLYQKSMGLLSLAIRRPGQ